MKKKYGIVMAALLALAGFSVSAAVAGVGVRINGVDLISAFLLEGGLYNSVQLGFTDTFMDGDLTVKENIWWMDQSTPSASVDLYLGSSSRRDLTFLVETASNVEFIGTLETMVNTRNMRVEFGAFKAGSTFRLNPVTYYYGGTDTLGRVTLAFGSQTLLSTYEAGEPYDVLARLSEEQYEIDLEFSPGASFSFDVSPYLPPSLYASKSESVLGELWTVREIERQNSFTGPAIGGTLPPKDDAGDLPATPVSIRIDDELTLDVKVKRSNESQPLVDDKEADTGVFYGSLDGYEDVQNVVVVKGRDGMVFTEVNDFQNGTVYQTTTKDGVTATKTIHLKANSFDATHPHERHLPPAAESQLMAAAYSRSGSVSGAIYVDMLVVYDSQARKFAVNEMHGMGITNFAQAAVSKMNVALMNSGLADKFRFRLLGVLAVNANANGDLDAVLDDVVYKNGAWAAVAAERDRIGADLVSILVDTGSAYGWTGLGYSLEGSPSQFKNYGFNACAVRSVAISDTMTHEVGHNMGAGHADAAHMETEYGPQFEPCSSGYYFKANGVDYHTIMAYDTDKDFHYYYSAPFFSTPGKSYRGTNVGDASHDNTSTIVKTYLPVSNFRAPSTDIVPPPPTVNPTNPTDPVAYGEGDDMSVTAVSLADIVSGYDVEKATKLLGCTLDAGRHPTGMFELKVGKANRKTGISKITGSYTPLGGKKVTLKAVEKKGVDIQSGRAEAHFTLKGMDNLEIVIGADFAGNLVFAGRLGAQGVSSVESTAPEGVKHFTIDSLPAELDGVVVNQDYLPTSANGGEPINMDGKWTCAKAMSVKYKKLKGELEPSWVENNGKPDDVKTNRSGLKLSFTEKKGTFKGSFTVYGLANGKFKKLKFTVSGIVVEGKVFGVSTCKKVNYPCTIK